MIDYDGQAVPRDCKIPTERLSVLAVADNRGAASWVVIVRPAGRFACDDVIIWRKMTRAASNARDFV